MEVGAADDSASGLGAAVGANGVPDMWETGAPTWEAPAESYVDEAATSSKALIVEGRGSTGFPAVVAASEGVEV